MQFSKEQNLTFEQAVEKMFEKLGDSKIMALASAVGTHVMVRNVSCLFYNNKIYFKTDKNFRKTQQLFENPNVALCWSGVQVEGVAENKTSRGARSKPSIRNTSGAATTSIPTRTRRF